MILQVTKESCIACHNRLTIDFFGHSIFLGYSAAVITALLSSATPICSMTYKGDMGLLLGSLSVLHTV